MYMVCSAGVLRKPEGFPHIESFQKRMYLGQVKVRKGQKSPAVTVSRKDLQGTLKIEKKKGFREIIENLILPVLMNYTLPVNIFFYYYATKEI